MYKTIVTKQTSYDLRVFKINFFGHHLHKKSLTNCIHVIIISYFSLNMQFLKVNFHLFSFISFFYFFYYTFFCLKIFIKFSSCIFHSFEKNSFSTSIKISFSF